MSRLHVEKDSEDGLGLVELMVSILVIGLVLSALASVLVTTLRETHRNEALVQATAIHQQILERTVSLPWELVGLYSDETGYSANVTEDGDTFSTVDLGPAGSERDDRVPRIRQQVERGGVTYDVVTDVYQVDAQTKRVRTTVSWTTLGGQTQETVFHATRTQTGPEADQSFEILHYAPSPSEVHLDEAGETTTPVTFNVQLTDTATSAQLTVPTASGPTTMSLTALDGENTRWTATLDEETAVPAGDQLIELTASSATTPSEEVSAAVTVTFIPAGGEASTDFEIESLNVVDGPIELLKDPKNRACDYTVEVFVRGFPTDATSDDVVAVKYDYWNDSTGSGNAPNAHDTITGTYDRMSTSTVAVYVVDIPATSDHHLRKGKEFQLTASATPANESVTEELATTVTASEVDTCSA